MGATGSRNAIAAVVLLMLAPLLGARAGAAAGTTTTTVSCGEVVGALAPCGGFLTGAGPAAPSSDCCKGAMALRRMATTADTRRAMCRCMVQSAPSFGVLPARARMLPTSCNLGTNVPVPGAVSDCNKIS